MKLYEMIRCSLGVLLVLFTWAFYAAPEPNRISIVNAGPNYEIDYGYWLEGGDHFVGGFDGGFVILNTSLEVEEVHVLDEPGRVRVTADRSTAYFFPSDSVKKITLSDGTSKRLAGVDFDKFFKRPVWDRKVFSVPFLPQHSSVVFASKDNPYTDRSGLWDLESERFLLDGKIGWDEYYRLGVDDEPLLRIAQSHDEELPFVSIEYRDSENDGNLTKIGLGDHYQTTHISQRLSSVKEGGYVFIDGDSAGPNLFTIVKSEAELAIKRAPLEAVEGPYQVVSSIDLPSFHGRIRNEAPFDIVDAEEGAIELISQVIEKLPEDTVSVYNLQIDPERHVVVGRYTGADYSKWLFRSEQGKLKQRRLSVPDEIIGAFEIRHIEFEESVLDILQYKPTKAPALGAVIYVHGGPHFPIGRSNLREVEPWLQRGYEVWMLPYYGTTGYGADFAHKIYNGGVEKTGTQLNQTLSLAREAFPDELVGVVGNSFAGLVTGFALLEGTENVDFIWLDMPLISVCDSMSSLYFHRSGEPRDLRALPDGPPETSPTLYDGLNGTCDASSKFKVAEGKVEPIVRIYKEQIKKTPIKIRHGSLDRLTSPKVSHEISWVEGRHDCSGFRLAGNVAHEFGDFEKRARSIDRFMECVEADQ
ncbi:MAG: hypothetical protein AAFR51_17440 [Pseudomonadota bacterium]